MFNDRQRTSPSSSSFFCAADTREGAERTKESENECGQQRKARRTSPVAAPVGNSECRACRQDKDVTKGDGWPSGQAELEPGQAQTSASVTREKLQCSQTLPKEVCSLSTMSGVTGVTGQPALVLSVIAAHYAAQKPQKGLRKYLEMFAFQHDYCSNHVIILEYYLVLL